MSRTHASVTRGEVTVIDLLGQQKFEEALQTAQEVQEKSQQIGDFEEERHLQVILWDGAEGLFLKSGHNR